MQFHCQNIIQALILTNVFLLFMHIAYNITGNDITFWVFYHAVLEKEMATHSIVLAWRIPGTLEPGGLQSMGSHRVGYDWGNLAAAAWRRNWLPTSVFLPGKSHGQRSLAGYSSWGCKESIMKTHRNDEWLKGINAVSYIRLIYPKRITYSLGQVILINKKSSLHFLKCKIILVIFSTRQWLNSWVSLLGVPDH